MLTVTHTHTPTPTHKHHKHHAELSILDTQFGHRHQLSHTVFALIPLPQRPCPRMQILLLRRRPLSKSLKTQLLELR